MLTNATYPQASTLYAETWDVLLVQREMGHSSVAITQVYLQQLGATGEN